MVEEEEGGGRIWIDRISGDRGNGSLVPYVHVCFTL